LLERATLLPTESVDYEAAAALYRHCRSEGRTVRKLIDCLIAGVAMSAGVPGLQRDADFMAIAGATELAIDMGG
jgi:predicted nucleic acid-binding protein